MVIILLYFQSYFLLTYSIVSRSPDDNFLLRLLRGLEPPGSGQHQLHKIPLENYRLLCQNMVAPLRVPPSP
jgi:hypothetical protein